MNGCIGIVLATLLCGPAQDSHSPHDGAVICRKIQWLVHETHSRKDPRLVEYLKSLSPHEALAAARYACAETANDPEFQDLSAERRSTGAAKAALTCLSHFFHNCESTEAGGRILVEVVADKHEHPSLRRAIVASMVGGTSRRYPVFIETLGAFVEGHKEEVYSILTKIAMDKQEDVFLRSEAVRTIAVRLRTKARLICASDPDVEEEINKQQKQAAEGVSVEQIVRSGGVTLSDETTKALQPIVAMVRSNVELLAGIIGDKDEPIHLRKEAKSTLESYRRSSVTQVDGEIDKALDAAHE